VTKRALAKPGPLVVQQMAYHEREAVEGDSCAFVSGLARDGIKHGKARDLCFAAAGLPTPNLSLVAHEVPKERPRGTEQKCNDAKR
jgi:hypothetical protein